MHKKLGYTIDQKH